MDKQTRTWPSKSCVLTDVVVFVTFLGLTFTFAVDGDIIVTLACAFGAASLTGLFIAIRKKFHTRERLPGGVKLWAFHGLLSVVVITMLISMPNSFVASFFEKVLEWCGIDDPIERQLFVSFDIFDWMILYVACGLQLNVSVWASVRQFTSKKTPTRGYDQVGNSFCLICAPAFIFAVIVSTILDG